MNGSSRKQRSDPACGTCRKKCRKCDRARPACTRCIVKGLVCEGYPTTFKIYNVNNAKSSRKSRQERVSGNPSVQIETETASKTPSSVEDEVSSGQSPDGYSSEFDAAMAATVSMMAASVGVEEAAMSPQVRDAVSQEDVQKLMNYYENVVCEVLPIPSSTTRNPFKSYILPLAYRDLGLLNAVLGLAACHLAVSTHPPNPRLITAALQHRLNAIQSLSSLLLREECFGLKEIEEEIALALVLTLVLHDICESGKSLHGAHLNGVAFLCSRIARNPQSQTGSRLFLVTALAWFDFLRGFSGPEKLAFPSVTRQLALESDECNLSTLVGCPAEIFTLVGEVLVTGKQYLAQKVSLGEFKTKLADAEAYLRSWDSRNRVYPDNDIEWQWLADAYRHASILRVLRFPDTFEIPCTDPRIRESTNAILDIAAKISWDSPFYKRLLFPIFIAGAETAVPHRQHYAKLCIDHIRRTTGFPHPSLSELLERTWQGRHTSDETRNVPWMEYTCSVQLQQQHDFLFF